MIQSAVCAGATKPAAPGVVIGFGGVGAAIATATVSVATDELELGTAVGSMASSQVGF